MACATACGYESAPAESLGSALLCEDAEAQSPRDVTDGVVGERDERFPPIMDFSKMTHVNTHFHLGAEHHSSGEYDIMGADVYEGDAAVPGWFCPAIADEAMLEPYTFEHCLHTEVGMTYELHWVYSTGGGYPGYKVAGTTGGADLPEGTEIVDGLGGALARTVNPYIGVQAGIYQIVNGADAEAYDISDFMTHAMDYASGNVVAYQGSTTGTSYDNTVCSAMQVSWHVDKHCHMISAASFDKMCEDMHSIGMEHDLEPHNSRTLVSPAFIATSTHALS